MRVNPLVGRRRAFGKALPEFGGHLASRVNTADYKTNPWKLVAINAPRQTVVGGDPIVQIGVHRPDDIRLGEAVRELAQAVSDPPKVSDLNRDQQREGAYKHAAGDLLRHERRRLTNLGPAKPIGKTSC